MAATPITKAVRYYTRGVSKAYFAATIADIAAPTRTEMDAGTDLSPDVAAADGWPVTSEQIDTPDLASTFTSNIPGTTSVGTPTLTMYASKDGVDARGLLPRGTKGFILLLWGGDVTGSPMDVFPVTVRSVGKTGVATDDPARLEVAFSVTSEPAEDVAIPV